MPWTLVMDGWCPPSVNLGLARHWAISHRLKREVKERVAVARILAGTVPNATGKRRVSVVAIVSGRRRVPDPDNLLKYLLDACTANRLIVDDAAEYCEIGTVAIERGYSTRTLLTLEDIDDIR